MHIDDMKDILDKLDIEYIEFEEDRWSIHVQIVELILEESKHIWDVIYVMFHGIWEQEHNIGRFWSWIPPAKIVAADAWQCRGPWSRLSVQTLYESRSTSTYDYDGGR